MLASALIDLAESAWLYPGGRGFPPFDTLDTGIDDNDLTFDVTGLLNNIESDTTVEIDSELMLTGIVTADTPSSGKNRVTVLQRAWGGSTAASHLAGARVRVKPDFPRTHLLNALRTVVDGLYAEGVYKRVVDTSLTYSYGDALALPAAAKRVVGVMVQSGTGVRYRPLRRGKHYEVLHTFSPLKVMFNYGATSGRTLHVVYGADYDGDLITSEAFDLSHATLDVPMDIQKHLPMAIAGYVLQGHEIGRINVEDIRDAIAAAGAQVPVGSSLNIGQALLAAFRQLAIVPAYKELREQDRVQFSYVGA